MAKKPAIVKPAKAEIKKRTAPVTEVKVAEVKEEVKAVEAPEAVETPKAEEVKAEKAPVEKKTETKAEKKPVAKKTEVKADEKSEAVVYIQYKEKQCSINEIVEKVKEDWVAQGHRLSSIKSLNVYVKPEDYAAYYVINDKTSGKVWM